MESINQAFIVSAASKKNPVRADSRLSTDSRHVEVDLGSLNGQAEIRVGKTVVRTTIQGEITPPAQDRPNEGRFFFNVELGQISNPDQYEYGRPSLDSTTICNYVERVLRGSKAIDTESLCVLGGRSVWSIRADTHVLNDDGALLDACCLSVLCALLNFRHSSVSFEGGSVKVFESTAREPVPLSVHHLPISTSFVVFKTPTDVSWFIDPTSMEEDALGSTLSVAVNQYGELCGLHKPGGIAVDPAILHECIGAAIRRAQSLTETMQSILARR
jgi:exosome complex component RRP45